jgi:hypothetical protein
MSQSPFPGPIAPENNPAIMPQYFKPSLFDISAIALGITTLVTTSVNHNYVIGQEVRLIIPPTFGAQLLNQQTGFVQSIPNPDQVLLNINSLGNGPFIGSPSYGPTPPQIAAIGDVNSGIISSTGRDIKNSLLPGSFQNISPAPFL